MSDQTPTPAPEPKRKSWVARHKVLTFIGACIVIGVVSSVANGGGSSQDTGSSTPTSASSSATDTSTDSTDSGTVTITVTSTGSHGGSVTYMDPSKSSLQMSQDTSARFPWKKTWTGVSDLPIGFNMNAQQSGGGTITCTVKQDGKVIATNNSSGNYSMVTCAP